MLLERSGGVFLYIRQMTINVRCRQGTNQKDISVSRTQRDKLHLDCSSKMKSKTQELIML